MDKPPAGGNTAALEQFILLSKTAKGAAASELIRQSLEAPGVYVFGELLDMPNIRELANGPHSNYYNLLNLFAYGSFSEYKANQDKLPPLSAAQLNKLRLLTIISLATKNKCLPYSLLLNELDIRNLRELEDLIIDAIYSDIIHGKLDQKHQQLEVEFSIGRDIRPEHIQEISHVLDEWCSGCDALLKSIESQIVKANANREKRIKTEQQVELEVTNIKKTLKTAQRMDSDEQMVVDSHSTNSFVGDRRKNVKTKSGPYASRGSPAPKSSK